MTTDEMIDKTAAELVEELLTCPEGLPWFFVVQRKMAGLIAYYEKKLSVERWRVNSSRPSNPTNRSKHNQTMIK